MMFNETRSVFNEEYEGLVSGFFSLDRKCNVLWGTQYQIFFLMEPDEEEIGCLVAEMVMLRALENT